jgi:hypothetical protein
LIVQVLPVSPIVIGMLGAVLSVVFTRPGDVACNCHPVVGATRESITVLANVNGFVFVPIFTAPTLTVTELLNNRLPALVAETSKVQVPPTEISVAGSQAVAGAATAALVCIANAPAIIPTSMKIAANFRMLRFFKILIENPFLCLHIALATQAHKREIGIYQCPPLLSFETKQLSAARNLFFLQLCVAKVF